MRYVMLLAHAPDAWEDPDAPREEAWAAYSLALQEAGVLVGGNGLRPADVATTVRVRNGERLLTDGPFAESKEHLIGFYVIEVPDLDSAVHWAARAPVARTGSVELRPELPGTEAREMAALAAAAR